MERAGIKPAATTDELFEEDDDVQFDANCHLDNSDTGMNSESSEGLKEDRQKNSSDISRKSSNTPRSNKKKDQKASKKKIKLLKVQIWMGFMLCL